jgi:hypothetical protein
VDETRSTRRSLTALTDDHDDDGILSEAVETVQNRDHSKVFEVQTNRKAVPDGVRRRRKERKKEKDEG